MGKIGRWLDRRLRSMEKSSHSTSPAIASLSAQISEELGADKAAQFESILLSKADFAIKANLSGMPLSVFAEKWMLEPEFRKQVEERQPSNFHRSLLAKSMNSFAIDVSASIKDLCMSDLEKAVLKRTWSKVAKKVDPEANLIVDHSSHMKQFPVHKEYGKMLSSDVYHEHVLPKGTSEGISAKMIHEVDDHPNSGLQTFMAKPYHKKLESKTRSWVKTPITGWATMATKALFNAGNIGHLAEDVSAHEHEGVPLTVHKFAEGFRPGGSSERFTVDPLQIHQIGVMDYLANNLDRHSDNILYNPQHNTRGYNDMLAIDHERNFQYHKPLGSSYRRSGTPVGETPHAYINYTSLKPAAQDDMPFTSHHDLVDWWTKHGQDIKDEMEKQLSSIKDESVRKHVRDNFNSRWNSMNEWADMAKQDPEGDVMYDKDSIGKYFNAPRMIKPEAFRITARAIKALPKNPRDALFTIGDMVNKKPNLTYKQRMMLSSAINSVLDKLTPDQAAETLKSLAGNPYLDTKAIKSEPDVDPKNRLLRHFWEGHGRDDDYNLVYKYDHMKALADAIESMPEDKRGMLDSWLSAYRSRLDRRREEAA